MTRSRIVTCALVLALTGLGLTVLMAANGTPDKPGDPAKSDGPNRSLVSLGHVDSKDKVVGILPDNFPQPARVTKVLVREGAEVKEGQELLQFDTALLALKVREAETAVEVAKAELEQAQAALRGHQPQVDAAEEELLGKEAELNARKEELEQARRAYKNDQKNLVELKAPEAAVKAAEHNLKAARVKLDALKKEVPSYLVAKATANLARWENTKAQADHAIKQVACKAPADGRIIRSFVAEGTNFGLQSREPAFWFVKQGDLIVRAEVIQEFAGGVFEGQAAEIVDEADDKQTWKGKVTVVPHHFLPKRLGNTGLIDIMPVSDDRVLECQVSIELVPGGPVPRFGQKVRVKLPTK